MTTLSPGLALGCFELLEMSVRRVLHVASITKDFTKIGVMPAATVLDLAQTLNWIRADENGHAIITVEGNRILSFSGYEGRVRQALLDYIDVIRPPWIHNVTLGRSNVIRFAGSDITQVFAEAGLVHGTDQAVVGFWDELAARARGERGVLLNTTGREGERLTIEYETKRTGREPKWISVDSNMDGYDVLSIINSIDKQLLSIEVKASKSGLAGYFHLTPNEWMLALKTNRHLFHLWDMSGANPSLAILSKRDVKLHVPKNHGKGQWESVKIPFRAFSGMFKSKESLQRDES